MGAGHSDVGAKARFSGEAGGGSGPWQINTSVLYRESKATLERGIPVGTKAGK